jgi:hypothetical protein
MKVFKKFLFEHQKLKLPEYSSKQPVVASRIICTLMNMLRIREQRDIFILQFNLPLHKGKQCLNKTGVWLDN